MSEPTITVSASGWEALNANHRDVQRVYAEVKDACARFGMERYCTQSELLAFLESRLRNGASTPAYAKVLELLGAPAEGSDFSDLVDWARELKKAAEAGPELIEAAKMLGRAHGQLAAAEARVKELEGLVSIEEKIAIKHTQLIAELSAQNAHLRKSLGEIDELKAQLKGTLQAGGYEHFTAQVRNAQEQAHNAIYVAQQLEKKVAALESRDKQQREALQAAAEVFESLDAVEWPQSDCDVFHGNAGCCPVDYSQAQQAVNAALTNDQTTNT